MELNKVYNEDCLEGMKRIPDKSVNLIVIDPPYNIKKAKWDKWKTVESYVEWMTVIFKECERVLKDTGSFYWFHNDMNQIWRLMQSIENETSFIFKQFIVWNKRFNEAKNKGFLDGFVVVDGLRNYQQMAEYCLFYTFQDETGLTKVKHSLDNFTTLRNYFRDFQRALGMSLPQINKTLGHRKAEHAFYWKSTQWDLPIPETYEELLKLPRNNYFKVKEYESLREEYESLREEYESLRYTFNNLKSHHSVWDYEIAPKQGHITPKPVELIENIIKHSSNEGGVVLDCFMGSFTTAIACINTKRNYIGFELDETYYQIGSKRVGEHLQKINESQISLF